MKDATRSPTPVSVTFSQTTRALDSDRGRRNLFAIAATIVLFTAWGGWFFFASVTEYAVSETARLEVERAAHPVDTPVGGRIVDSRLVLGTHVKAGDVVLELDAESERRRLAEERARLAAIEPQIAAIRRMIEAQEQVLLTERGVTATASRENDAHRREALAAARLAADEAKRARSLYDAGAISESDLLRSASTAEQKRVATDALGFGAERQHGQLRAAETRDLALIEELRKDLVDLEGRRGIVEASVQVLTFEVERRRIVAPVDGRVADATSFGIGTFVKEGERLGTIVPIGRPRIVASFAPGTALGRVREGHSARARVETYPWIEFGTVSAKTIAVGSEPREGRVRVELDVDGTANPRIPLEHGLVCTVEVAVGRASPASLVLRAVGRFVGTEQGAAR